MTSEHIPAQRAILLECYGSALTRAIKYCKLAKDPCANDLEGLLHYLDIEGMDRKYNEALDGHVRVWSALSLAAFVTDGFTSQNRFNVLFKRAVKREGFTRFTTDQLGFHRHVGRPVSVWALSESCAKEYYSRVVLPQRPQRNRAK